MKNFLKYLLASVLGVFIASVLIFFFIVGILSGIIATSSKPIKVAENSTLWMQLNGEIVDRKIPNPFEDLDLFGMDRPVSLGLNNILEQINKAKSDTNIKGIYLNLMDLRTGYATTEEIRNSLKDFKKSGKFIYAYSNMMSQKAYYLASVADSIFVNPEGGIDLRGIRAERTFFKKALDKLGIEAQVIRGKNNKFKAAVEPFLREDMSPANKKQTEVYIGSLWKTITSSIAESRGIPVDVLNQLADEVLIFHKAEKAVEAGLIDGLKFKDQVIDDLKQLTSTSLSDDISAIKLPKYIKTSFPEMMVPKGDKIAVIYANGEIDPAGGDEYMIDSKKISKSLREARRDSSVKAVVLRVNSPGGSAFGSEVILREVKLSAATKPVIVSMGDQAASGGYYISCGAHHIMSSPLTLTGSIGIFGIIPNFGPLMNEKLGLTTDKVMTNAHSDMPTVTRRMTQFEKDLFQERIERGYQTFITHVSEGRNMNPEAVDNIGQGRVWSGENALDIGLVDGYGGLEDAIELAREKAGIPTYQLLELPQLKDPFEKFIEEWTSQIKIRILTAEMGESYQIYQNIQKFSKMNGVMARLPYELKVE